VTIYITGGRGYIGSHLTEALVSHDEVPVIIDDSSGANRFPRIQGAKYLDFSLNEADASNKLIQQFERNRPTVVIHLSGYKSVEISITNPNLYEETNLKSTENLVTAMTKIGVDKIIFASSAAVYGVGKSRVNETASTNPISTYGEIKLAEEKVLARFSKDADANIAILRFFNVVGASSNKFREINGGNIFPMLYQAINQKKIFKVFGSTYPTNDGTCIRDYIDVRDLIAAILICIERLNGSNIGIMNLASGRGTSVLDIVRKIKNLCEFDFEAIKPRAGDIPELVADISKARSELSWSPIISIDESIKSSFL